MNRVLESGKPPVLSWVVIVGRPNVGKSTLFNRILGKRDAIVDDQPGVTRDVLFRLADWNGKCFTLADTGGVFGPDDDPFSKIIQEQIEMTARNAAVILFLVDGQTGPVPLDHDIALFYAVWTNPSLRWSTRWILPSRRRRFWLRSMNWA